MGEVLGSQTDAENFAFGLSRRLLSVAPAFEGVPQLNIWEEGLLLQLIAIFQNVRLDAWITNGGYQVCRLMGGSHERLAATQAVTGSTYSIEREHISHSSLHAKVQKQFSSDGFRAIPRLMRLAARRMMPCSSRFVEALPGKLLNSFRPGGAWFYNTSYNDTGIGIAYDGHLGMPLQYVFNDPTTAGRKLREAGKPGISIHSFLRFWDLPNASQVKTHAAEITRALGTLPLSGMELQARDILLRSPAYAYFLRRLLPLYMMDTRAARRMLEATRPEILFVGNPAWQRPLLLQARERRIPTVLLQHGVMAFDLRFADQPVDTSFVRGQFFQQLLNPSLKERSVVLNIPASVSVPPPRSTGRDIIFISAPLHVLPLYHEGELREIIGTLLAISARLHRCFVVRVHPMESVGSYRKLVGELCSELGVAPEVIYSQGPGLDDALKSSAVAVLFFSTVFLDCLRLGVPIVSFDWHEFPYKAHYKEERIFNFADDLAHLSELVEQGAAGQLPYKAEDLELFLWNTSGDEIAAKVRSLLQRSPVTEAK
ncbi:MAG TPA: hypothetical protein VN622_01335 [Clostridia bacterium]|nr:hypothetical protein [Clostridia bacterium]